MAVPKEVVPVKIATITFCFCWLILVLSPNPCVAQDTDAEKMQKLEDIVVSSTKMEPDISRTPTNVTIISREDIAKYKARDVLDLLQQIPGLDFIRDAYGLPTDTQLSTRGSEPSAFLLKFMVNGH
jgi:outer membrane cobalamin receptor